MVEQLFGSKTRVKLLNLFYSNPNRAFYVREITRKIDEQINSVRRELSNLLSIGIIVSETNNNRLYYEINQEYEHYGSLSAIFGGQEPASDQKTKSKTETVVATPKTKEDPIVKTLRSVGKVDLAILSGQFTRDDSSGVDMLLVGDINQTKAARVIAEIEEQERKSITYDCYYHSRIS